jgi:hypothetical protein
MGKALDLNKLCEKGAWGRCFKCRAKLEGKEKLYGFCRKCFYEMGVRNVRG